MRSPRSRKKRSLWQRIFFRGLALLALIVLGCCALVLALRWIDPPFSAFMLQDRLFTQSFGKHRPIEYRWRPWNEISSHLFLAVIAAEDQKFPHHPGFDLDAIRLVLEARFVGDANRGAMRGASTISQQVAKNLFLWPGRSWLRKALEAGLTVLIEALWSKRRILEVYSNVAQFGDDVYGAEAAAQHFFGKSGAQLTSREAALMAAVLPNPVRLSIEQPSAYVRERQKWILRQMRQLGGSGFLEQISR